MDDIQQSAADAATEASIEAVVTNAPPAKLEAAFSRASVEHRRSAPAEDGSPRVDQGWRDGNEVAPLGPMPPAPSLATREVDAAIVKMNNLGGEHSALVQNWGSDFPDNFAFAKAAFADIAANRPDLIQKFDRSGLGDDVAVIEFLSRHGRLSAGLMNTMPSRNNEPMSINRTGPIAAPVLTERSIARHGGSASSGNNRGSEETRTELNRLMNENPPGSQRYKDPHVQARIQQLNRTIAGSGSPIGIDGRTS